MYCKKIISLYPVRIDPEEPSYCRKEMPMPQPTRYILWVRDSGAANAVPRKKPLPSRSGGAFSGFLSDPSALPPLWGKARGRYASAAVLSASSSRPCAAVRQTAAYIPG